MMKTTLNNTPSSASRASISPRFSRAMLAGSSAITLLAALPAFAQTNPVASSIPYSQDFGTTTFTTPPAGFAVWNGLSGGTINTLALAEGSAPTGDATIVAQTASTTTGGAFGYALAGNAKLYIQTSSNATNGVNQPVLAVDTTGKTNITVSYDVDSISAQSREVGIVCQYRIGTTGTWTTLTPTAGNNPYSQTAGTVGLKTTVSALLPAAAEGQATVQIRWALWRAGSGNSSGLAIDNIAVTTSGGGPDISAPMISTLTPADGNTTADENANLVITFNETVQKGTAGNIVIVRSSDSAVIETIPVTSTAVTVSGNSVTIDPTAALATAIGYHVLIDAGAIRDNATTPNSFAGISDVTAWNFTTRNAPVAGLVISEVYGGGGNGGAVYMNDFVELYNSSASAINLTGYSLQYAASGGSFNNKVDLTGTIPAGAYFLIQLSSGGSAGTFLPSPSLAGALNLSATAGKVALVNSTTTLTGAPTDPSVLDYVGYGAAANAFEGAAPAPAFTPSSSTSITRNASNADTNDNSADFAVANPPTPQNTSGGLDMVAPMVNGFNPADGSLTASNTQNLSITFSEPVVKGTGNIVIHLASDDSVVATIPVTDASVSIASNIVTINPTSDLLSETGYYVRIDATAFEDAAGNDYAGIAINSIWNFTTEPPVIAGTLAVGDIAFVGFTGTSEDHLSFVALKAIPAGEIIRFTDNEWNGGAIGTGSFNTGEGYLAWTAPASGVAQGTVVRLDNVINSFDRSASVGTVAAVGSGGTFDINLTGETVYAFQGGIVTPTSFLAVVANTTVHDSLAGTLLSASNVVYLPASTDHYQFTAARNNQGSFASYLPVIANAANWATFPEAQDPAADFIMTSFTTGTTTGYATWATVNGATTDPLADHDGDGVRNALEFFMGQTGSTFTMTPGVVNGTVTWPKDSFANASYVVKTSTDLVTWVPATSGVVDNGSAVVYTLPGGQNKMFIRLEVTVP